MKEEYCTKCLGSKLQTCHVCNGGRCGKGGTPCKNCNGTGVETCTKCAGTGKNVIKDH